jgi:hypothetical protein
LSYLDCNFDPAADVLHTKLAANRPLERLLSKLLQHGHDGAVGIPQHQARHSIVLGVNARNVLAWIVASDDESRVKRFYR